MFNVKTWDDFEVLKNGFHVIFLAAVFVMVDVLFIFLDVSPGKRVAASSTRLVCRAGGS